MEENKYKKCEAEKWLHDHGVAVSNKMINRFFMGDEKSHEIIKRGKKVIKRKPNGQRRYKLKLSEVDSLLEKHSKKQVDLAV